MNKSDFYSIRPEIDDVMWAVPIRWYDEGAEPERVVVLEKCKEHAQNLYVMHDGYGHPVYMDRAIIVYKRETAMEIIKKLNELRTLIEDDGHDVLFERIFDKRGKANE